MKRTSAITISIADCKDKSISWTMLVGCKAKYCDSKSKHGSMQFDDNQAALVKLGIARHPCLILTDVLKTEMGKAYLDGKRLSLRNGQRVTQSGLWREDSVTCRDKVSGLLQANNENSKSVTPDRNHQATFLSSERLRRRSQNADEAEDKDESREIREVMIGMGNREEVVDCDLTVSWKQPRDAGRDEFSPASRKDKRPDPTCEMQHSLQKRKRGDTGTNTPKGRGLHFSPERGSYRRQTPVRLHMDRSKEDGESESLDDGIVQVIVGEDMRAEAQIPVLGHNLEDRLFNCGLSVSRKLARDAGVDESSPARRKDKCTDPGVQKRKRDEPLSYCIGTDTPKGRRGNVLHLSPERGNYRRQTPVRLHLDKHKEDGESESQDDGIVQVSVGGVERTEAQISVIGHNLKDMLSSSKESTTKKSPSEFNCGLSVSRKLKRIAEGDESSPASRTVKCNDPGSKRKRDVPLVHCIGTDTPKGRRGNVLHLSPEKGSYRRQTPVCLHMNKHKEDGESESQDEGIVQFTVGEDTRTEAHAPVVSHDLEDRLSPSKESTTKKSPSETNCRLSVSRKLTRDAGGDELSPASRKDKCIDPSLKRNRDEAGSHCIGTDTSKGRRESVLHLSPERGRYRQQTRVRLHLDERKEDGESGSQDDGFVQITVGEDERAGARISAIGNNLDTRDVTKDHRHSLSSSKDNKTQTCSSGTIVVSSDEEDGEIHQHHSPVFHPLVSQEETVTHKELTQETETKQQDISDTQDVELSCPSHDYPCMGVAFSELYFGCYNGKANGDIKITRQQIIIPLTDASKQEEVTLIVDRKQLWSYSIWEEQKVQMWWSDIGNEGPPPATVLQFSMSIPEEAAVESNLHKLTVNKDGTTASSETFSQASPVLLLTLRDRLEGLEGALLRSLLDIDCLSNLIDQKDIVDPGLSCINGVEDIQTPTPSLESTDPEHKTDQDCTQPDREKNTTPQTQDEPQEESELEPEKVPEDDAGSQLTPEDEQKEQEVEPPAETNGEEPTPIYTLRHARTRDSYSVSLAKPDSSWTKYKRQGQPHRLIQFPPPPLKGGISVTMDDLQCLDSGKYLNDVIIDFYLKYLLHNASAAVAERSYIFSSFFYNQLARGNNASKGGANDICQRQWRHQRVKNWTRHVDIFKKDFLFVPVNQEAHWFLVVICFPGLDEPNHEAWTGPVSQMGKRPGRLGVVQCREDAHSTKSSSDNTEASPAPKPSDNKDTLTEKTKEDIIKDTFCGPPNCTEQTCQSKTVCKRPCILIMDSLKRCLHQRVVKLLQEYLQSEWEVRRGSSRVFGPENMKSSCCQVPLQDNSTDCGLYLLQYVESFLKDPVVNFELPLHLEHWFSRQQMWTKRDEIRNVVLRLYRHQTL